MDMRTSLTIPLVTGALATAARRLATLGTTVRRIIGAPDYDAYLRHHGQCHAEAQPLSRDEFARQRLEARYSQPGNRCC
jgi:uncharacterized short protein YbdD (DUF466 family)